MSSTPSDRSDQTSSPDFQLVTLLRTLFFCSFHPSSSRPSHVSVYFCGLFFYIPGKKRNTQSLVHITTQETQLQPSSGEPSRNRSPLRLRPPCRAGSQEVEKNMQMWHNCISNFFFVCHKNQSDTFQRTNAAI